MKKVLLLFTAIILTISVQAQSQRMVLLEHFTQASCGPCATNNPAVQNTLNTTSHSVISINHQVSWPGYDPMNEHNPDDVDDRRTYYGVSGVPNSVLDGNGPGSSTTIFNNNTLGSRAAVTSSFDIVVSHSLGSDGSSIDVSAEATASAQVSTSNVVMHTVIVEKVILFNEAPGSNGEVEFHNVMKKMLPNSTGMAAPAAMNVGDKITYNGSWAYDNVYDLTQLAVVVFVQNNSTKEVLQAGYSEFITTPGTEEVFVNSSSVSDLPCGTSIDIAPKVSFGNLGTNTVTSLDIEYSVNGGAVNTFNWSGTLNSFESTEVTLPATSNYVPSASNTVDITLINPNGTTDAITGNNTVISDFAYGAENQAANALTLTLTTDNYGSETSWNVKDDQGVIVQQGSGYPDGNSTTYTIPINLQEGSCYTFNIYDGYGDGMCCAYGNGGYSLADANGNVVASGSEFASSEGSAFKTFNTVSTDNLDLEESLSIFPNPADNQFRIQFDLQEATKLNIDLMNALGQKVRTLGANNFSAGQNNLSVDATSLAAGFYFVTFRSEEGVVTRKVTIQK